MVDMRRLRIFDAVAQFGSVTRAARALGYSPSAVSQQIAAFEREAGTPLFARAGKGMTLTRAGATLRHHTQQLLESAAQFEASTAALRATGQNLMRIGASPDAAAAVLPRLLSNLTAHDRTLTYEVVEATGATLAAMLQRGDLDATITEGEAGLELATTVLAELPLGVATATTPRLGRTERSTWWIPADRGHAPTLARWILQQQPDASIRDGTSVRTALGFVEHGLGSTVASRLDVAAARVRVHLDESHQIPLQHRLELRHASGPSAIPPGVLDDAARTATAELLTAVTAEPHAEIVHDL